MQATYFYDLLPVSKHAFMLLHTELETAQQFACVDTYQHHQHHQALPVPKQHSTALLNVWTENDEN